MLLLFTYKDLTDRQQWSWVKRPRRTVKTKVTVSGSTFTRSLSASSHGGRRRHARGCLCVVLATLIMPTIASAAGQENSTGKSAESGSFAPPSLQKQDDDSGLTPH